jgi:membrane-bound ClpP family serine protease
MIVDPQLALVAVVVGLLGIYAEFIWPGKVVPGIAGGVALLVGLASLGRSGMPSVGFTVGMLIPLAGISIYLLRIAVRAWRNKRVV